MPFPRPQGRRGFTLVEILVVITIIALISAVALPVVLPALNERRVSEAARIFQAVLVGTRDAAIRSNAPRGIRLLPDPILSPPPYHISGSVPEGVLTSNRFVAIEPAPDYSEGMIASVQSAGGFLQVLQVQVSFQGAVGVSNEPTAWAYNIRQGDKIRFNDAGTFYTVAGPMQKGPSYLGKTPLQNSERFINDDRYNFSTLTIASASALGLPVGIAVDPTNGPIIDPRYGTDYLNLVNGVDDDNDGWVDEGFDGIDNDGDGVTDPGYNGIDDNGDGNIDEPAELLFNAGGEFEQEVFIGAIPNAVPTAASNIAPTAPTVSASPYTIVRRPIVSPGSRETTLPDGVVIDLTTWNAPAATSSSSLMTKGTLNGNPIQFPERSRVPVDPYTYYVDIMVAPSGQVVQAGAGSAGMELTNASPTSNMPFYHFWITERAGVVGPLWTPKSKLSATTPYVPGLNPNYPTQTYLLPMPQGTPNYSPATGQVPQFLTGERRLVTLFTRTGQVLTSSLEFFDGNDLGRPFYDAQSGIKEPQ